MDQVALAREFFTDYPGVLVAIVLGLMVGVIIWLNARMKPPHFAPSFSEKEKRFAELYAGQQWTEEQQRQADQAEINRRWSREPPPQSSWTDNFPAETVNADVVDMSEGEAADFMHAEETEQCSERIRELAVAREHASYYTAKVIGLEMYLQLDAQNGHWPLTRMG